ncbi:MAG: HAD-IC family P-type ATPase, partial [Brevundimonas sp.]|nr:HAD-IC family P-type ATPase [Brevundimonas sp.]
MSPEPSFTGLDAAEAARRLETDGPNLVSADRTRPLWRIVAGALREPMFLLLAAATALYLGLGDRAEGLLLGAAGVVTIGMVVAQEARSEAALRALRRMADPVVRVVRDGRTLTLPAREIVRGDLVVVAEGQRIPADGVLVGSEVVQIDESILTGESAPVVRSGAPAHAPSALSREVFAGTLTGAGQGVVRVTATGPRTALGRIGASLATIDRNPTPLQRSTGRIVALIGALALTFAVAVSLAYGLLRDLWIEGALAGITIAIALIPEEFPVVLSVFLSLGAWRLAQHRVLVRRAAAIEALGGATVLCVDKTGTLTGNRMEVVSLWSPEDEGPPGEDSAPSLRAVLEAAILASSPQPTDPMDAALPALGPGGGGGTRAPGGNGAPDAVCALGWGHPALTAAARSALDRLASNG